MRRRSIIGITGWAAVSGMAGLVLDIGGRCRPSAAARQAARRHAASRSRRKACAHLLEA
jgi:hypothetical protein